jgi:menaquinone-dependent protoporphyrinogen oxidase
MNKRIAIIYGTTEGHTRKISEHIADALRQRDERVDIFHGAELDEAFDPGAYDGVIIGASVHAGNHQRYIRQFCAEHADQLAGLPAAFFSVSLAAVDPDSREEVQGYIDGFVEHTGWRPEQTASFAGALLYTQYNWLKRFIMKRITASAGGNTDTSQDFEYTDWDDVERFAREFHARLQEV